MMILFGSVKRTFKIYYRRPLPTIPEPANDNGDKNE